MSGSMKTKVISSPFNEPLDPENNSERPKRREKAAAVLYSCVTEFKALHVSSSNRRLIEASLAFRVARP